MKNVLRPVLLLAAALVLLTACDPGGSSGPIEPYVIGTVVGYTGPRAQVDLRALNPIPQTGFEYYDVGNGIVEGGTIKFTLEPAPVAALFLATEMNYVSSDPELRISLLTVNLAGGGGWFELGNTNPRKPSSEFRVGDSVAQLMYADRPGTLSVPPELREPEGMTGGFTLHKGWNVVKTTVTKIGPDVFEQRFDNGDLGALDWYFAPH